MSLLPKPPSCLCQFLSPNVNLFLFFVFFQWDVGLVARGATRSRTVRGGGGKTRGEGGEIGEEGGGGEEGGQKWLWIWEGGGWVCTFKIRGRGWEGGEAKWQWIWEGASGCVLLK